MQQPRQYHFRSVVPDDLGLLNKWQTQPHVSEWWDSEEPTSTDDLKDHRVARWIVSLDNTPFAYMQDYTVHGWSDHPFFDLPEGSRGIDQFIGDPNMTGQGHGPAFIAQRTAALFQSGAPVIATDPHPKNTRAIAAYQKAGFKVIRPAEETQWGPILPMAIYNPT